MKITMENSPRISLILLMIYGSMEQWTIRRCPFLYLFCVRACSVASVMSNSLGPQRLSPETVAHQAPLSVGFSGQEYWSGLPFPPPGESSRPRDQTQVSCIAGRLAYHRTTKKFGEGNGTPLQYSCLENPMDGGAWWATVHEVAKSRTRLSNFTFTFHFHALEKEMATHSSILP